MDTHVSDTTFIMNTKRKLAALAGTLITFGSLAGGANAAVIISNYDMSVNSVSFSIAGELPSTVPPGSPFGLAFYNPDIFSSPGFVLGPNFLMASSSSFIGSQSLDLVQIGRASSGDYFFILFDSDLAAEEAINGDFSASWSSDVFDPAAINSINVEWGLGNSGIGSSVQLGSVSVPEPSSALLGGAGVFLLLVSRRLTIRQVEQDVDPNA